MRIPKRLKVLFINTYDMNNVHEMYTRGSYPGHHLFGVNELRRDYNMDVIIPVHVKYPILNKIGGWLDIGFLDQQIRAILNLRKYDILYTPGAAGNTKLIILGKLLGVINKPVVILVHQPLFGRPSKNPIKRLIAKKLILAYDTIIFYSKKMMTELIDAYEIDAKHAEVHFFIAPLGVDANFFNGYVDQNDPQTKRFVISSGNNGRDFDILIRAFERINFPLKIYCREESLPKAVSSSGNVEVLCGEFPFDQICRDYAEARIILIPLAANPSSTYGFTSLLDAIAMGKPTIMTRNERIDVDLLKEGVGLIVQEDDVDGWIKAVSSILENSAVLEEMKRNCLRLANEELHIRTFAKCLATALENTHARHMKGINRKK
jgi:glycosyltransferase involved in cell wall biosynthesis